MKNYCIANKGQPLPESEGSLVLRVGMGITGRVTGGKVPASTVNRPIPLFTLVAENRAGAKEEVLRLLDELIDAFEGGEKCAGA